MNELDKMAKMLYGPNATFESISEFGKRTIRQSVEGAKQPTMKDVDLAQALAESQRREAALLKENKDLWEDNEELQLRLMEIEDEDSSSRSTKHK